MTASLPRTLFTTERGGIASHLVLTNSADDARLIAGRLIAIDAGGRAAAEIQSRTSEISVRAPTPEERGAWDAWVGQFHPQSAATPAAVSIASALKATMKCRA